MKQFTVKDFIIYNNPCFSCGEKINLRVHNQLVDCGEVVGGGWIRPLVTPEYTLIDLVIEYNRSLQLYIYHKTNKIDWTNIEGFPRYLKEGNRLILQSECTNCKSVIDSEPLEFNVDKLFVKPVEISTERLHFKDKDNNYHLTSYFHGHPMTEAFVYKIDSKNPRLPMTLKLPLLPLYKFKTKERIIEKLKTYIIFS